MSPEAMTQSFITSIEIIYNDGCMAIVKAHDNLYTIHRYSMDAQLYTLGSWYTVTEATGWTYAAMRRHAWPNKEQ